MDIINEYHKSVRSDRLSNDRWYREPVPAIECNDGFCISVQASEYSYCGPRMTAEKDEGVEIGRQSMKVEVLRLIARRRESALTAEVIDELGQLVDEIAKL